MLSELWCYTLSFMVICHFFACLCDSFPGKCASFLHMLRVITDLLPEWIKSLSSRWLMKSCKFFYSPIKRNRCFTSRGIKTLVQTFGSKRKKLDHLTNTTHPGAYAVLFLDAKTDSTLRSILLFFSVILYWRNIFEENYKEKVNKTNTNHSFLQVYEKYNPHSCHSQITFNLFI